MRLIDLSVSKRLQIRIEGGTPADELIVRDIGPESTIDGAAVPVHSLIQEASPTLLYFRQHRRLAGAKRLRNIIKKSEIDAESSQIEQQAR